MHPVIRHIGLINGDDLEDFQPKAPDNFSVEARVVIGPSDGPGEESFDVSICTVAALEEEMQLRGFAFIRRRLLIGSWKPDLVREAIHRRISTITGDSWQEIANKLSEFSAWEFENYVPQSE
jgi:hypothetical protein